MKPKFRANLIAPFIAISLSTLPSMAGTTWDGGGGDTNIDTGANWNPDGAPAFDLTQDVTFGTGGSSANVNVNGRFKSLTMNRTAAFTYDNGGGKLILRSSNSGSTYNLTFSSAIGGTHTVNCGLQIDTNNADANKLLTFRNNRANSAQPLDINGDISLATGSTVNFNTRFECVANSLTRFDGAISGLTNVQQSGGVWAGDIVFGGSKTMTTSNVNIASTVSGVGTPNAAARLFLGESPTDIQSWGNITLNNTMKLVIGGTITAGNLSVGGGATAANTRIVGNSATNSSLSVTGGTINDKVTVGGAGTNENNLDLVKTGTGTLAIDSGTHTYTGSTTVNGGTLAISSTASTLASNITLNAGATLSGEGATSGSLKFGAGNTSVTFDPGTAGAFTADTVDVSSATLVRLSPSAATTVGVPYVALKRNSGTFTGADLLKFAAGLRGSVSLTGGGTEVSVVPTTPISLVWKGTDGTNPSYWDIGTTSNWSSGTPDFFYAGDSVTFDDTASSFTVALQSSITAGNITFNNTSNYTLSGGGIGGSGTLVKGGTGLVTLPNVLSHTGGITLNAGILSLGTTNTNTFTGGILINGGELQFGGASIAGSLNTQAITLNGGTITRTSNTTVTNDAQTLAINANGSVVKVDSGALITWRIGGKISGSGNWTKTGTGILSLGRGNDTGPANDFTGTLTVTEGMLDIRHADSLGSTAAGTFIQNAVLFMQNFSQTTGSTLTVSEPLTFTGNSFLNAYCQENKNFTHQYNGPISIAANAVVGISAARNGSNPSPLLELTGTSISTNAGSTLKLGLRPANLPAGISANAQTINISAAVTGSGSVSAEGDAGSVYSLNAPQYSGNTTVNSGTLSLGADNANNNASTVSIAATGATLDLTFAGTDTVSKLFIGGVQQPAGVYEAVGNAGSGTEITQITGSGTLTVTSSPAAGYSAWQTANAPGQTVDQDHDNDGVDNGIEYFMGQSGNGFTATPVLNASNNITWTMGDDYAGTYATDYVIQTSSDLTTWASVPVGNVTIDNTAPGKSVSYTLTGSGKRFVRLLVNPD